MAAGWMINVNGEQHSVVNITPADRMIALKDRIRWNSILRMSGPNTSPLQLQESHFKANTLAALWQRDLALEGVTKLDSVIQKWWLWKGETLEDNLVSSEVTIITSTCNKHKGLEQLLGTRGSSKRYRGFRFCGVKKKRREEEERGCSEMGNEGETIANCSLGGFPNRQACLYLAKLKNTWPPRGHCTALTRAWCRHTIDIHLVISFFPSLSFQTDAHSMDIFNHFFPSIFEWDQKHAQLPPGLNTKPDTILKILHNHHLLVQEILWPQFTIKAIESIKSAPPTTVFILEKNTGIFRPQRSVTCISFDDGVSCMEEILDVAYRIHWTVTPTTTTYNHVGDDIGPCSAVKRQTPPAATPGQCFLTETVTTAGIRLAKLLDRLDDCYDPKTTRLVHFLSQIASGEVSMSDVSEGKILLATTAQQCLDAAKLKKQWWLTDWTILLLRLSCFHIFKIFTVHVGLSTLLLISWVCLQSLLTITDCSNVSLFLLKLDARSTFLQAHMMYTPCKLESVRQAYWHPSHLIIKHFRFWN